MYGYVAADLLAPFVLLTRSGNKPSVNPQITHLIFSS